MVHNGIEQGQLSVLAEAWSFLHRTLGISNEEIKDIFNEWNERGELSDDFLVDLGSHILSFNVSKQVSVTALKLNKRITFSGRGRQEERTRSRRFHR